MKQWTQGFFVAGALFGLLGFVAADASAQLTKDQQKCVNAMNKGLTKTAATIGKEVQGCLKDFAKGKNGVSDIAACVASDRKGKVAKAEQKVVDAQTKKCTGVSKKGGTPKLPAVFVTDAATVNQAAADKEAGVLAALFGSDVMANAIAEASDKNASKCQQALAKSVFKCQGTKLKEFSKCKKFAIAEKKTPFPAGATTAAELEECLTDPAKFDAKGKIAKACDTKILGDLDKKCVGKGVALSTAFPQCGSEDIATVHDCLETPVECEVCKAINAADDLDVDCDLFDNGAADGSCAGGTFVGTVGDHKCVLSPNSQIVIQQVAFPIPAVPAGAVDISCGTVDPQTGKAPCDCSIQDFDPILIAGIGFVCITPGGGCNPGEIDCDGGNQLDVDLTSEHDVGSCTSNADCSAQCDAFCANSGAVSATPGCEGFCKGGANDELACLDDSECPGGSCPGPDGGAHGNICGCNCVTQGIGAPSAPGALACELPTTINVESAGPCGDGDVLIAVGSSCIPLTTQISTSIINQANDNVGSTIPSTGAAVLQGNPFECGTLAQSVTTGGRLVGAVDFFDSTIGDLNTQMTLDCQ